MKFILKPLFFRPPSWSVILVIFMIAMAPQLCAGEKKSAPRFFSCFGFDREQPAVMAKRYAAGIWHDHADFKPILADLKKRNPDLIALMYRETFCILEQETPLKESVGHYRWIDRRHPEWFQLDLKGRRIEVADYPGRWVMDFANPGWQDFWIRKTLRDVRRGGWDGVFADDVLTSIKAHQMPPLAGYSDDPALQKAVYEFLSKAHQAFRKAGKLLIANVSNSYDYPGLWERWLEVTDGLMEEHFSGDSWSWGKHVALDQMEAMRTAARKNKYVFDLTYGGWDDAKKMQTSLAAYLVISNEKILWSYRPADQADEAPWHDSWQIDLGEPDGQTEILGDLWQRKFEYGIAAVNVGRVSQSLRLGEKIVSVKPHTGVILPSPEATHRRDTGISVQSKTT